MGKNDRKTVLIVDDEEIIREFLSEVLCDDFDVCLAGDGQEAIEQLSQRKFDLIITDLKMPHVSGDEVVRFAKDQQPKTPVIIISGYSTLYAASQSINHGACAFLSKPFSIAELTRTVDESLESNA